MRYLSTFVIGVLLGTGGMYVASVLDGHEYFTVRILDNDKCSDPVYSILMQGYSVRVSDDQIRPPHIAREAEAFIHVMPAYNGETKHRYRVTAEYSDCETVQSDEREVERGRILYEWIDNGKIRHQVRA